MAIDITAAQATMSASGVISAVWPSFTCVRAEVVGKGVASASYNTGSPFVRDTTLDRFLDASDLLNAYAEIDYGGFKKPWEANLSATATISATFIPGKAFDGLLTASATISAVIDFSIPNKNWVAWSKIGSISFAVDRVNDAGRMPLSWEGWALAVKPLGKYIIVYGLNGVSILTPVAEPAPTFAMRDIHPVGILSKGLVAGTDKIHYFVDANGNLVTIDDSGVKIIGYQNYLKDLNQAGAMPVMHYDPLEQRVYICNSKVGYIVSKVGLGSGPKSITAMQRSGDDLLVKTYEEFNTSPVSFTTNITDCGIADMKPLKKVTISSFSPEELQFSVGYRTSQRLPLVWTDWNYFNFLGEGFVECIGIEFAVSVRSLTPTSTQIDDLVLHILQSDRMLKREVIK